MHIDLRQILMHIGAMKASDVRRLRAHLGLSQAAFAKIAHVSQATVSRWERSTKRLRPIAVFVIERIRTEWQVSRP